MSPTLFHGTMSGGSATRVVLALCFPEQPDATANIMVSTSAMRRESIVHILVELDAGQLAIVLL